MQLAGFLSIFPAIAGRRSVTMTGGHRLCTGPAGINRHRALRSPDAAGGDLRQVWATPLRRSARRQCAFLAGLLSSRLGRADGVRAARVAGLDDPHDRDGPRLVASGPRCAPKRHPHAQLACNVAAALKPRCH
jgi:hypothetical protein